MRVIVNFFRFWYDFIVGDDWTIALAVVVGLGFTAALANHGFESWWLLPLIVLASLIWSVWRVAHRP